jgi:hypothetical protein
MPKSRFPDPDQGSPMPLIIFVAVMLVVVWWWRMA